MTSATPTATSAEHTGDSGPIKVTFGDVSLFCAWMTPVDGAPVAQDLPGGDVTGAVLDVELRAAPVAIARWAAARVVAVPLRERGPFTVNELGDLVVMLLAGARAVIPADHAPYFILHVGAARALQGRARGRSDRAGRPLLTGSDLHALVEALDGARERAGLTRLSEDQGWDALWEGPAYFELYSRQRRRYGHLIFDPRLSMVVDAAEDDARVLLDIVQQAAITPTGLSPASYLPVLSRVTAWVANADVQAAIDSLRLLDRAGRSATIGGVLLTLALAGFSTLLALTQLQTINPRVLIVPTALYAAAALLYAVYLITGWRWLNPIGVVCLVIATLLCGVVLVAPDLVRGVFPQSP